MRPNQKAVLKMTVAAVCVALGIVLPLLIALNSPDLAKKLSPMHIPVFLCGFLAGPFWGGIVGIVTPLLRSVIFQIPKIYPDAVVMAFELCTYGVAAGFFYRLLPKKSYCLYIGLIGSMLVGRIVYGVVKMTIFMIDVNKPFYTWELFLAEAFVNAVPGIVLHVVAVPLLVIAIRSAVPSLRRLNEKQGRRNTE